MVSALVVVGLGNPGHRYAGTRHNVGFMVLDRLAESRRCRWRSADAYEHSEFTDAERRVFLVKPQTYVNRSGVVVSRLVHDHGAEPTDLLVVADDIALPLGRLRLRLSGSDGGHNGLRSIIAAVGSGSFPRLRIGVGPVPESEDAADFVLEPFSRDDASVVAGVIERAEACIETVLRDGFENAMNTFNRAPESD